MDLSMNSPILASGGPPSPQTPSPSTSSSPIPTLQGHPPSNGHSNDPKYYERRRKNNLAAKKSRDNRKIREEQILMRLLYLEQENSVLRSQLAIFTNEIIHLRESLAVNPPRALQIPPHPQHPPQFHFNQYLEMLHHNSDQSSPEPNGSLVFNTNGQTSAPKDDINDDLDEIQEKPFNLGLDLDSSSTSTAPSSPSTSSSSNPIN